MIWHDPIGETERNGFSCCCKVSTLSRSRHFEWLSDFMYIYHRGAHTVNVVKIVRFAFRVGCLCCYGGDQSQRAKNTEKRALITRELTGKNKLVIDTAISSIEETIETTIAHELYM